MADRGPCPEGASSSQHEGFADTLADDERPSPGEGNERQTCDDGPARGPCSGRGAPNRRTTRNPSLRKPINTPLRGVGFERGSGNELVAQATEC